MKGTDVTPEQLAHAEEFLQAAQGKQIGPRGERLYTDLAQLSLSRGNLVRLLAWYGAIRAKGGRETPNPLVHRCACANPGVDLMTTVCDCVTPTTTRCDCHATEHEFHDPRPEGELNTKSDERCDIGDSCVMGSAPTQYVCDCNAPGERKCEHGYCDSKNCRCLCHDKSLHESPDTKAGPGDCMDFGTAVDCP